MHNFLTARVTGRYFVLATTAIAAISPLFPKAAFANSFHTNIFTLRRGADARLVSTGMEQADFGGVVFEPQYYVPRGASSSLRTVYFREGVWGAGSEADAERCNPAGPPKAVTQVPVPADFRTSSRSANHFSVFEMPDGTVREVDLFQWCEGYSTPVSNNRVRTFEPKNNPIYGAKGGSNLSGYIGGIFPGDLTGSKEHLGHVLDLTLPLAHLSPKDGGYSWPASKADRNYEKRYYGTNPNVKMGSLLVLPENFPVSKLQTEPAKKIARTLMLYGGIVRNATPAPVMQYVVNTVPGKTEVRAELSRELGYNPTGFNSKKHPFYMDMLAIQRGMKVVADNTPATPGGAGPRMGGGGSSELPTPPPPNPEPTPTPPSPEPTPTPPSPEPTPTPPPSGTSTTYSEDFDDNNAQQWVKQSGNWSAQSGKYHLKATKERQIAFYDGRSFSNYTLEAKALTRFSSAGNQFGAVLNYQDASNYYRLELTSNNNPTIRVIRRLKGSDVTLASRRLKGQIQQIWNTLAVQHDGSSLSVMVNGETVLSKIPAKDFTSGKVGLFGSFVSASYDDVVVRSNVDRSSSRRRLSRVNRVRRARGDRSARRGR